MFTDPTVDGLKTGHTGEAGYCLVASSKRGDMRLISVIMGTKSMQERADQSRELLNWGFGHFSTSVLAPANQVITQAPVAFGEQDTVEVATQDALKVLTTRNQQDKLNTVIRLNSEINAPISKGQNVGQLLAVIDGKPVASVPLVATSDVEQSGFLKRAWTHLVNWISSLF